MAKWGCSFYSGNMKRMYILMGFCVATLLGAADARPWALRNGQTLEAEFIEVQGSRVVVENAEGGRAGIPLAILSPADQDFVCEQIDDDVALDPLLDTPDLWTLSTAEVMSRGESLGLEWVDEDATALSQHPCLQLDGRRVWELLAYFKDGQASQIVASLYNRGDSEPLPQAEFKSLLGSIQRDLTEWAGSRPSPIRESRGPVQTRLFARAWVRNPHQVLLQWSVSRDGTPEFIRLRLSPSRGGSRGGTAAAATAILGASTRPKAPILNSLSLRSRIQNKPNGDKLLPDVPMVDQGQKGYCAAAITERVLRYYGRDFDQHQVAQIAGSTAQGGTRSVDLVSAISRFAGTMELNFRKLVDLDIDRILRLIKDYNRAASKKKLPPFEHDQMIDVGMMFQQMDPDTLQKVRTSNSARTQKFFTHIEEYIGKGVPLIWGVQLGLVDERPELPQAAGGHMRLIIGCNPRTREILYSDSWGSEHALKRMSLDDAWTITTGLYVMLPRNIR